MVQRLGDDYAKAALERAVIDQDQAIGVIVGLQTVPPGLLSLSRS